MEREKLIGLVTAAQKGDTEAMNQLFSEFYNDVYYFALQNVKDSDLACDITQETFVEIINTVGDLHEPAAFVKWMRQITYHQCTRYFKKKKDVLVDEDEEGNSVFDVVAEDRAEFIPDEALDQQDFRKTILAMLDTLSEEQRAATLLYYYDELSVKQIAEIQGVSEGTVKSRLNYARKSIKKSVEDYEKKNNIKLHSFAFFPFMFWLLKAAAAEEAAAGAATAGTVAAGITAATGTTITATAVSSTAGVAASGAAAATGATAGAAVVAGTTATAVTGTAAAGTGIVAKIVALPLAVKVVSVITAGAIVVGSVGIAASDKNDEPTIPSTSIPATSEQTTPPTTLPAPVEPSNDATTAPTTPHLHEYEETVVAETCTEQGYTIFTCACGDSYEDNFVAARGHSWDAGVISKEPTEDAEGERIHTCTVCSETNVVTIPASGHEHSYTAIITEPTCTQQGYTTYSCICGHSYSDNYLSATGHTAGDWIVDQDPTSTQPGKKHQTCVSCGVIIANEEIPAIGSVGLAYTVNSDGETCTITGLGTWTNSDLYIPEYVDGYRVTVIGSSAFENQKSIISVNIPASVSSILGYAFWQCSNLQSVVFADNSQLTEIQLGAFGYCSALTTFTFPEKVEFIGEYAFTNCQSLPSVIIPATVTDIEREVFQGCDALVSIDVASGNTVFHSAGNCIIETASKTLVVGCSNSVIPSDGSVISIGNSAFIGCRTLNSITIPNTVTMIGMNAFIGCSGLTELTIPDSVTVIDGWAFSGCENLKVFYFAGSIEAWNKIEKHYAWNSNLPATEVICSDGVVSLVDNEDESTGRDVSEGSSYITVDGKTFSAGEVISVAPAAGDTLITVDYTYTCFVNDAGQLGWDVVVNDNTKTEYEALLGEINGVPLTHMTKTFMQCSNLLQSPAIPDSVTEMTNTYFYCTNMTVAPALPDGITKLAFTFDGCHGLTAAPALPKNVQDISWAFGYCMGLEQAPEIPEGVTNMESTFQGCTSLIQAPVIPESVVNMNSTFSNCTQLVQAPVIPANVSSMASTFLGCSSLTGTVTIDASPSVFDQCFHTTILPIVLTGKSQRLPDLAATSYNGNVTVAANERTDDTTAIYDVPRGCISLNCVSVERTTEQWNAIQKGSWHGGVPATEVVCSDGVVTLEKN